MSVNNFIPEVWSAALQEPLYKNLVFANLANHDYEGEISGMGDTVRISEIGDILISTYTKNSTTALTIQELTDAQQILNIDQALYFNFFIDDVDQAQTKINIMPKAMERAGYNLKDAIDQRIATITSTTGGFFTGLNSTELGSTVTPLSCASTLVVQAFSWYDRIMNQNNVPTNGRWIIFPPALSQQLRNAQLIMPQSQANGVNPDTAAKVGNFYGFDIYISNNVYGQVSSQYHVIAGHSMGLSFAGQINKVEAYRPQTAFSDAVKGLYVYGAKVIRPQAIIKGVLSS